MEHRKEGLGFLFGLLVGSLVGASIAIIVAPQSGEKTRELLKDRALDYKERATDFANDLKEDYEDLVTRGRELYESKREQVVTRLRKNKSADGSSEQKL
ncbi:MAG: YtxH domain-containing protein [Armatimonadetes bacterium]|nr:YtxH domain-containing protein [Armatimonadota bacterium]